MGQEHVQKVQHHGHRDIVEASTVHEPDFLISPMRLAQRPLAGFCIRKIKFSTTFATLNGISFTAAVPASRQRRTTSGGNTRHAIFLGSYLEAMHHGGMD